ncbi:thiol-disulfide oxidoreductase DCC family protein [Pinibacter aurantiacus]|uniref:Thiol-disulfide oxidoreductase DCC family protein n=1 Tax=Pinibacter aurantiacus TaxID=2851599 RepID=A0A9E2SAM1_9BACT|nr:thiol-disulfide oxidoreductase DCC family protein [Pinibacter aurantiacus]MBV4356945.1 thiol-disulfide oxidoreductase DCC family protein [Pinibacter aurantiacus]
MQNNPVILFDGVCNLCNSSVQFVIKRDKQNRFQFASLQSDFGQRILSQHNLSSSDFNSFLLFENDKLFTKSTGALKVLSQLQNWRWSTIFLFIPKFIRDAVYSFIARNRYRWFGKREACWVPTPELKAKFLQ